MSETISFTVKQAAAQQKVITAAADLCEEFTELDRVDLGMMAELVKALQQLKEAHR